MSRPTDTFRVQLKALLPRLRRFGCVLTGRSEEADDLLQDALEKALMRESQFEPGTRLDSWMYRIMQTTWIDHKRAEARRNRRFSPMPEGFDAAGEDGERTAMSRLELKAVRAAMAQLPEDERATLALVSLDGMTYREAADTLDIPIGTVMSRISRARARLLAMLDPAQGPPAESGPSAGNNARRRLSP
jgi:RNA polymerase sigma-70 factor, ECF subfamily